MLLSAAGGVANEETARRVGVALHTVRAWRRGLAAGGLGWLGTAPGRVSLSCCQAVRGSFWGWGGW